MLRRVKTWSGSDVVASKRRGERYAVILPGSLKLDKRKLETGLRLGTFSLGRGRPTMRLNAGDGKCVELVGVAVTLKAPMLVLSGSAVAKQGVQVTWEPPLTRALLFDSWRFVDATPEEVEAFAKSAAAKATEGEDGSPRAAGGGGGSGGGADADADDADADDDVVEVGADDDGDGDDDE